MHPLPPSRICLVLHPLLCLLARTRLLRRSIIKAIEQSMKVTTPAITNQVGIISRGAKGNPLSSTAKEVTKSMSECLQLINAHTNFVMNDVVVGGTRSTLQALVCLKVEIVIVDRGDTAVDNQAGLRVAG